MNLRIEARSIVVTRGRKRILDQVDFQLPPCRKVALVGPNGSGKTTLLRVLAGLVSADSGKVFYAGQDRTSWTLAERARFLAWAGAVESLEEGRSVAEVLWAARFAQTQVWTDVPESFPSNWTDLCARWELTSVSLSDFLDQSVDSLSTGELQLVHLVRAIFQETPVLLLDEPTSALDLRHQLLVEKTLNDLAAQKSIVWSVHDLKTALRWSDEVCVLEKGRVVASGPTKQTLTPELVERVWKVRWNQDSQTSGEFSIEKKTV